MTMGTSDFSGMKSNILCLGMVYDPKPRRGGIMINQVHSAYEPIQQRIVTELTQSAIECKQFPRIEPSRLPTEADECCYGYIE